MMTGKSHLASFSQRFCNYFTSHYAFSVPHFFRVQQALITLETLVSTVYPGVKLRAYGSSQTGLSSSSSDVDVSLELPQLDEWLNKVQGNGQPGILPWSLFGKVVLRTFDRLLYLLQKERALNQKATLTTPAATLAQEKVSFAAFQTLPGTEWGTDASLASKLKLTHTITQNPVAKTTATIQDVAKAVRLVDSLNVPIAKKALYYAINKFAQHRDVLNPNSEDYDNPADVTRTRAHMLLQVYIAALHRAGWAPHGVCPHGIAKCRNHTAAVVAANAKYGREVVVRVIDKETKKIARDEHGAPLQLDAVEAGNASGRFQKRCVILPVQGKKLKNRAIKDLFNGVKIPSNSPSRMLRIILAQAWMRFRSFVATAVLSLHTYLTNKSIDAPVLSGKDMTTLMAASIPTQAASVVNMPAAAYDDINVFSKSFTPALALALTSGHSNMSIYSRVPVLHARVPVMKMETGIHAFVALPAMYMAKNDPSITVAAAAIADVTENMQKKRRLCEYPLAVPTAPLHIDLCVNNSHAYYNSMLLRTYLHLDPRFLSVARFIKAWAKDQDICNTQAHTLSAYAYTLMFIAFIQAVGLAPCLQNITTAPKKAPGIPAVPENSDNNPENGRCSCGARILYYFNKQVPCACTQPSYLPTYHRLLARVQVLHGGQGLGVPTGVETTQFSENTAAAVSTMIAATEYNPNAEITVKPTAIREVLAADDDPHAVMTQIMEDNVKTLWNPVNASVFGPQEGEEKSSNNDHADAEANGDGDAVADADAESLVERFDENGERIEVDDTNAGMDGDGDADADYIDGDVADAAVLDADAVVDTEIEDDYVICNKVDTEDHDDNVDKDGGNDKSEDAVGVDISAEDDALVFIDDDEYKTDGDNSADEAESGNPWQPILPTFFREDAFSEKWAAGKSSDQLFSEEELASAHKLLNSHNCYFYPHSEDSMRVLAWALHEGYIPSLTNTDHTANLTQVLSQQKIPNSEITSVQGRMHFCGINVHECSEVELLCLFFLWIHAHRKLSQANNKKGMILSIRTGGVLTKEQKKMFPWKAGDAHLWLPIEDPFDWSHDLSRIIKNNTVDKVDEAFTDAFYMASKVSL